MPNCIGQIQLPDRLWDILNETNKINNKTEPPFATAHNAERNPEKCLTLERELPSYWPVSVAQSIFSCPVRIGGPDPVFCNERDYFSLFLRMQRLAPHFPITPLLCTPS